MLSVLVSQLRKLMFKLYAALLSFDHACSHYIALVHSAIWNKSALDSNGYICIKYCVAGCLEKLQLWSIEQVCQGVDSKGL